MSGVDYTTVTCTRNIPRKSSADEVCSRSAHKLLCSLHQAGKGREGGPNERHMTRMMRADPSPLISTNSGAAFLPSCWTKLLEANSDVRVDLPLFPALFTSVCNYTRLTMEKKGTTAKELPLGTVPKCL
jgi:hypothetical protein